MQCTCILLTCRKKTHGQLSHGLSSASTNTIFRCKHAAEQLLLLLQVGISFTPYLEHVAQRVSDPGSLPHGQLPADYLKAQLEKIDSHGVEGSAEIDKKEASLPSRTMHECLSRL